MNKNKKRYIEHIDRKDKRILIEILCCITCVIGIGVFYLLCESGRISKNACPLFYLFVILGITSCIFFVVDLLSYSRCVEKKIQIMLKDNPTVLHIMKHNNRVGG